MPDPLRLGYLVPQFPSQTHSFFWREIKALEDMGANAVLLSTRPPVPGLVSHAWSQDAADRTRYLGRADPVAALGGLVRLPPADLVKMVRNEPAALWRDILISLPAAQQLVQAARQTGFDHVHVHSCGRAALIAALAFRMGGPRYSLTLHGLLSDYGPGQRFKWRHAAFATVVTEKLRAEVVGELGPDLPARIEIQPMGVDADRLSRRTPWVPPDPGGPVRVFSCGRLNVAKGHQELMLAVRQLRESGHDVRLTIAGEDDAGGSGFRGVLEARICELGLGEVVRLLGATDEDEVHRQLLDAHVFALASHQEALGVALMEAMACELPTIGPAIGGVAELITDGVDGLLVPPRSPDALAQAILQIVDEPEFARRLGLEGRRTVVAKFGAARGAATLLRLIRDSCGASARGAH